MLAECVHDHVRPRERIRQDEKGWFKEAGLDVKFQWFDYSASMDAFSAGKIDANLMTNGDTLVTGAGGGKGIMVMLTDYSDGNDMIVGKPGIKTLPELKGKKVGLEEGLVEHLLLLNGLKKYGMSESDVTLVNSKTNETPQVLASGQVDAIGAWQPISGQAMKALPGSRPVYTSADAPGLIYDALAVNPKSLAEHRADWIKLIEIWDRVVHYINDPKTQDDALKILSARVGLDPETYKPLLKGTHLIDVAEGKKTFEKGEGLELALRLDRDRQRLQCQERRLQGVAGRRFLYRPVADEGCGPDDRGDAVTAARPGKSAFIRNNGDQDAPHADQNFALCIDACTCAFDACHAAGFGRAAHHRL